MAANAVQVIKGFSLTNRWLLYTSFMLAPAQGLSGYGNNFPTNIGFLAYNFYTQLMWFQAAKAKELHALCLVLPHFNLVLAVSYVGGVTSGNIFTGLILGIVSAGLIILNTISAWIGWSTNQPDGYGLYRFFFFGWRTLTENWHKFFLVWQIFDSITALCASIACIYVALQVAAVDKEAIKSQVRWWSIYTMIPVGAAIMLLAGWPLILWTELIVNANPVESDTDWVSVWLFIAQVVTMLLPSRLTSFACVK